MMTSKFARVATLFTALFTLACDTPSVTRPDYAYDPTQLSRGLLYRWASGTTVRVWVVIDGSTALDLGVATRSAMSRWNAVPQFGEFRLMAATSIDAADIVVYDRVSSMPVQSGSCTFDARGATGYTYFCPSSTTPRRAERLPLAAGGIGAVTVVIRVDRGRVDSQRSYSAIVAHEFGHALGIGAHSDNAADLMFSLPTVESPSARDAATLQYVLGQIPGAIL